MDMYGILDIIGYYWMLLDIIGCYWMLLDVIGCYWGGKHIFRLLVWFAASGGEGIRAPHAQAQTFKDTSLLYLLSGVFQPRPKFSWVWVEIGRRSGIWSS